MTNMKKILATNRSMKAKGKAKKSSGIQFVELRRSAETGKRIYKPKRQRSQKKKESKKRCIGSDDSTSQVTKQHQQLFNEDQDMNLVGGSDMNLAGDDDMNLVDDNNTESCFNGWFELLERFVKKKKKRKTWFERSQACQDDWDLLRQPIWKTMAAKEVLKTSCVVMANGRCLDVCECLNDNKEITPTVRFPHLKCSCSVCGGNNLTKVVKDELCIIVTLKGRYDVNKYLLACKDCESTTDPFTVAVILCSGFWPGNPKSLNYLFKEEVFQLWDNFRKFMPGSSERAFLKTLNAISEEHSR
ncbi:uncharacterized protein, partial [Clytia hemisphaerica]|uniref:uncharacterized protein n=1 Tax=Clytia hemisphaerica TaxID=252671 RepID=UPI0034D78459